jgi:hypothetical protein
MDFFQTPALYSDDLTPTEWESRLQQMLSRAEATQRYRLGLMNPEDFEDALHTYGIPDPYQVGECWDRGLIWPGTP